MHMHHKVYTYQKMYKYSCVLSCLQFYLILLPLLVPALITLLGYIFLQLNKPIFICNQTIFNFFSSLALLAAVFCTTQRKCNTFTTFLWILILVHAIFVSICLHFFTSSSSSYNAAQAIIKVTIKP